MAPCLRWPYEEVHLVIVATPDEIIRIGQDSHARATGQSQPIARVRAFYRRQMGVPLVKELFSDPIFFQLAPMIEDVDLILKRNPCGCEMGNRRDDVARRHVTRGIVIETDDQYTRVCATRRLDHFVQVQEIVMISRH